MRDEVIGIMAKKAKTKDRENSARRKLADSQAKLESLQEKRVRAVNQGEREIEAARRRAADRIARTTRAVERRAEKVARDESRLLAIQAGHATGSRSVAASSGPPDRAVAEPSGADSPPVDASDGTPEDPAALLAELSAGPRAARRARAVKPARNVEVGSTEAAPDRFELRAMISLRDYFTETGGATFTEWLGVSGAAKRTFLRTRRSLVERGLVERAGAGQGARYMLTAKGQATIASTEKV
ncbi:MAG: hypothetical protein ACRDFX_12120 [Chloroflexota bacterium]